MKYEIVEVTLEDLKQLMIKINKFTGQGHIKLEQILERRKVQNNNIS